MAVKVENIDELLCKDDSSKKKVRVVCISDTHNKAHELMDKLPDGDILIHAGDFTLVSSEGEIKDFANFLARIKMKYKYVLVIAGNHDFSFDESKYDKVGCLRTFFKLYFGFSPLTGCPNPERSKELISDSCIYLEDEQIELLGIKIYGSPWQPAHMDWGFNFTSDDEGERVWRKIPEDTDILITHGPPFGIGDKCKGGGKRVGCPILLKTVKERVKPKYHIFGHVHECHGVWKDKETTFINAASCDEHYGATNKPVVFDYIHD